VVSGIPYKNCEKYLGISTKGILHFYAGLQVKLAIYAAKIPIRGKNCFPGRE